MSTTPEPADHRGEPPETDGPVTEAGHQVSRAPAAPAPVARFVPGRGLHRASTWTTLGTMGGPVASSHRAQPANLLMQDGFGALLVDSGDGAADQLAKAGVDLAAVGAVILSHLHIDHTAGLYGILGRRLQQRIPGGLHIYGPPGTRKVVEQITASQTYLDDLLKTDAAAGSLAPATVTVTEVTEGSVVTSGGAPITATTNSHYGFRDGTAEAARFQSLSYRFDLPGRSIVFTGDTGPSANVERLAAGADLLVSEIIDPDQALANLRASRPNIRAIASPALRKHFADQHLTAEAVGGLAHQRQRNPAGRHHDAGLYPGPVAFAADLTPTDRPPGRPASAPLPPLRDRRVRQVRGRAHATAAGVVSKMWPEPILVSRPERQPRRKRCGPAFKGRADRRVLMVVVWAGCPIGGGLDVADQAKWRDIGCQPGRRRRRSRSRAAGGRELMYRVLLGAP